MGTADYLHNSFQLPITKTITWIKLDSQPSIHKTIFSLNNPLILSDMDASIKSNGPKEQLRSFKIGTKSVKNKKDRR